MHQQIAIIRHHLLLWLQRPDRIILHVLVSLAVLTCLVSLSDAMMLSSHPALPEGSLLLFGITAWATLDLFFHLTISLSSKIQQLSNDGVLELCGTMSIKEERLVLWHVTPITMGVFSRLMIYSALMFIMKPAPLSIDLIGALALFGLGALCFLSMGLFSVAMTLLFKRTDPFIHVFVIVSVVLSGIFFPLRWFSAAWENLATFMPLTLTVEGVRALVMYEKPLSTQTRPLLGLALYAALLLPIAGFTLRQVIKKRKNDNSSGYY